MDGYQITFFAQEGRRHGMTPLGEWLIELAKELHLRGATLITATEGIGHSGRIRSAHFFELIDRPIEVVIIATAGEAEKLFARLRSEKVRLFYVKAPIEFGTLGE